MSEQQPSRHPDGGTGRTTRLYVRGVTALAIVFGVGLLGWSLTPGRQAGVTVEKDEPAAARSDVELQSAADVAQRQADLLSVDTDTEPPANPAAQEIEAVELAVAQPEQPDPTERREFLELCEFIAGKLGSVSLDDCTGSRLELSSGRAVSGAPILVAEYPPLEGRDPLGRVLLFGGIHGDEYSSVSIVFKWLSVLDQYHSGLFHWRIAPLVNPDGLLRQKSQRMNERGVDLNRNFPSPNWHEESEDYWVRRTGRNPRRYPGPDPLSEPESQWLHGQIEEFQPDVIIAVHAPSHVVDYDGPPEPPEKLGPLYLKQMGTYPGSLGRYAGVHLGLPVVTIELPSAGIMPTEGEQRRMWLDLVAWLRTNVPNQTRERMAKMAAESAVGGGM